MTDAGRILQRMSEMSEHSGVPTWTLGWRLKRALASANVGAGDMADYLGYSKAQISRYLNDKGEPPRTQTVRLWAMHCGVPFEWLAYGTVADPSTPGTREDGSTKWYGGQVIDFGARRVAPTRLAA